MDPRLRLVSGRREFGEHGGVNASIEVSTTFTVLEPQTLPEIFAGKVGPEHGGCYVYGRSFNPTVRHLGQLLARLEDTEAAHPCSSGMAAIACTLQALCDSGDHVVASHTVYGGTFALLKSFLPTKCGVHCTFVDVSDLEAVETALRAPRTKVLFTETVSNPTLEVSDLLALSRAAHAAGAALVVDNTFMPCMVTPAHHGADIVVHSLTKFISGASDIVAGAVCGPAAFINSLMDFHTGPCMLLGPTMDPRIASELSLRLPHLALRLQEHCARALAMAQHMQGMGAKVVYPGLETHPHHTRLQQMLNPGYGYGALLGLDMGSHACAEHLMQRLQNKHGFGFMAVSLGYSDTLMSLSSASTSSELTDAEKAASGIGPGYVRMSIGITGTLVQRLAQLEEALLFVRKWGDQPPYRAVQEVGAASASTLISWPSGGPDSPPTPDTQPPPPSTHMDAPAGAAETAAPAVMSREGGLGGSESAECPAAAVLQRGQLQHGAEVMVAGEGMLAELGRPVLSQPLVSPWALSAAVPASLPHAGETGSAIGAAASAAGTLQVLPPQRIAPPRPGVTYLPYTWVALPAPHAAADVEGQSKAVGLEGSGEVSRRATGCGADTVGAAARPPPATSPAAPAPRAERDLEADLLSLHQQPPLKVQRT